MLGIDNDPGLRRRAVLLDPFPLWLEAVADVLVQADVDVVAMTTDAAEAAELVAVERPDVLVADVGTDAEAIGYIREACNRTPETYVIAIASSQRADHIDAAFAAGASAYVLKTAHPDDLTSAIRQLFGKSVYVPRRSAGRAEASSNGDRTSADGGAGLTQRELEILRLVAEGHSNGELARMLWVTEQTVKFHLSNVYRKIGVANRTEAGRWAQTHGVLAAADDPVAPSQSAA